MTPKPHILLIGGHGAISQLLTPKLLSHSYRLTSLIRSPTQAPHILSLGTNLPGHLAVDITSLSSITSTSAAHAVLQRLAPDYVIWLAGAGGKGGPALTYAIDRDACIYFTKAAVQMPSVRKFVLVSHLGSRRGKASWWTPEEWENVRHFNEVLAPAYYEAKVQADEVLTVLGKERAERDGGWGWICLRPGALVNEAETGKVELGKTKGKGKVSRGDVAEVVVELLEKEGVSGWIDLLGGEEGIKEAVERVAREKVDSLEGEDLEAMKENVEKGKYE